MRFDNTQSLPKYEELVAKASGIGFEAAIHGIGSGSEYVVIQVPTLGGQIVGLVVHLRKRGCFASVTNNQLLELAVATDVLMILRELAKIPPSSEDELVNRLKIAATRSLTQIEWRQEEWTEARTMQSRNGWRFVDDNEANHLESKYSECIARQMSLPLGRLSNASVLQATWDIKHFFRLDIHQADALEQQLVTALLHAFQQMVPDGTSIIAREQNRFPILFNPHQGSCRATLDHWPLEVLPVERDVAFFEANCSFGYIGHYLSGTVTAFGGQFVSILQSSQSELLASRIQVLPPTIEEWNQLLAKRECRTWSRIPNDQEKQVKDLISDLVSDIDIEPITPCCTWDVSAITDSISNSPETELSVQSTLIEALNRHLSSGAVWYLWSHPYPVCKLESPLAFPVADPSNWSIPIISRYGNAFLVRSDCKEGILCFNRLGRLCLFGKGMSTEHLSVPLIDSAV